VLVQLEYSSLVSDDDVSVEQSLLLESSVDDDLIAGPSGALLTV
jgi:hypothetical protein